MSSADGTPPPPADPGWAYFLDVDGTLIEIAERPDAVYVPSDLVDLLVRLDRLTDGACALVSGRSVAALDALFSPARLPASGLHGVEWRGADGIVHHADSHDPVAASKSALDRALAAARVALDRLIARHPDLGLEDKGVALAVHYRTVPGLSGVVTAATDAIVAAHPALVAQHGKMVVELKPAGIDKGVAVRRFMGAAPFEGRRPVFLGDDLTDEYGFEAVNARGGISICVGDRAPSRAHYRLPSVGGAVGWLASMRGAHR